jgi:hypothetical protein
MTDLREGLILTVEQVKTGSFTYKGKEIKLEQDENNPLVFRGQTKLSKKEEEAGNLNTAFVYNAGLASGVVNTSIVIPDTDDFKDLTDSEKVTKLHSIEYQFGTEPTDDGKQLDHVLQNSVDTTPAQDKQTQQQQQQKQKEQKEKQQDITYGEPHPATKQTDSSTVKSGDKVQLKK